MKRGCNVIQSDGDADCQIVQTAINKSEARTATLTGEDTDLLILLLYHQKPNTKSLCFRSDIKSRKQLRVNRINKVKSLLGDKLCSELLFIHAFSGCDTTSRIHGIGKKALFQKFVKGSTELALSSRDFMASGRRNKPSLVRKDVQWL